MKTALYKSQLAFSNLYGIYTTEMHWRLAPVRSPKPGRLAGFDFREGGR